MSAAGASASRHWSEPVVRVFAWSLVVTMAAFLLNVYLTFWRGWPGPLALIEHLGTPEGGALSGTGLAAAWFQLLLYPLAVAAAAVRLVLTRDRSLASESDTLAAIAAYIVRAAFWAVLFIGVADMTISFLRVENLLPLWLGDNMATQLGLAVYRSTTIHYPLIVAALVLALFTRTIGFHWLALLVVVAEFQIVVGRFVFSYEQAFMGDLVRFWYAALFLFASAYTLVHEGHVRVDVAYTYFSERGKAWANLLGSLLLGIPICWLILARGMSGKFSVITSPLLSHEISQSGYGMYVKYLMAGFLLIYAISMMVQFASYVVSNAAILLGDPGTRHRDEPAPDGAPVP